MVELDLKSKKKDDGIEQLPQRKEGRTLKVQRWTLKSSKGVSWTKSIDK